MVLEEYLTRESLTVPVFAGLIGVQSWSLRRYLLGERIPDDPVLERIGTVTGWQVLPNDFYPWARGRDCKRPAAR